MTVEKILRLREAGKVRRCHVTPHILPCTVGQHCYDMLTLLLVLHPDPSALLMKAVILHDTHERWTGDMPATTKNLDIAMAARYAETCERIEIRCDLGIPEVMNALNEGDRKWLSALDKIDFWLWCHDELAMGNQNIQHSLQRVYERLMTEQDTLPRPALAFIVAFKEDGWRRTDERI